MRISVRALGMESTQAIHEHVERRVLFAVGRFSARLGEVSVRLGDANGPRGGTLVSACLRMSCAAPCPIGPHAVRVVTI